MTVLSGMSNMEQLLDNINTMTDFEPLTNNDYSVIENAVDAYKTKDTIPCTGCRYCMECPSGVDIPKMFKLYNQYAVDKDKEAYKAAYDQTEELERPESCVACGLCTQHCPQAIKIPEKLAMIKDLTKELFA
jgi:predicted aldo/keto reductase-like oxidoreductase